MQLKTKKVIAREFLVFVSTVIVGVLIIAFASTLRSYNINSYITIIIGFCVAMIWPMQYFIRLVLWAIRTLNTRDLADVSNKCPECGYEVSSQKAVCPKCAYPLDFSSNSVVLNARKKISFHAWIGYLFGICMLIVLLYGITIVQSNRVKDSFDNGTGSTQKGGNGNETLLSNTINDISSLYNDHGFSKEQKDNYYKAIEEFTRNIDANPNDYIAYSNRGLAKSYLHDQQGALDDVNKAIMINPQYDIAYVNRSYISNNIGDFKSTINDCSKAIGINPQFGIAYRNRGAASCKIGAYDSAFDDYSMAITLEPKNAAAYKGRAIAEIGLIDYKNAMMDLNMAITLNQTFSDAYCARGNLKGVLGDYNGALQDCTKAIKLNPKDAISYCNRAAAKLATRHRPQEAIVDYSKAIELSKNYAQAYYARGKTYMLIGNKDAALMDFKNAFRLGVKEAAKDITELQ